METNPDFKNMWQQQATSQPSMKDLELRVRKVKRSRLRHIFIINTLLGLTSMFIIYICIRFQPEMITTKIGIALMILAMGIFAVLHGNLRPAINKLDESKSAKDFVDALLALRRKQTFIHTTVMNMYFILLSAGIALYMIEYAMQLPLWGMVLAYALTAGWFAFGWFYLRPRTIKKQQGKLNELIEKFSSINGQLNN